MRKFFNKKIGAALIIVLAVFGLVFFLLSKEPSPVIATDNADLKYALIKGISERDSDLDGLKDWEETLWKTMPDNADTDQDGISDGDEVAQGENPLSKEKKVTAEERSEVVAEKKELNTTEKLSENLFGEYFKLKQNGVPISLFDTEKFETFMKASGSKSYSEEDIAVIKNPTTADIKAYGNSFAKIIVENRPKQTENELAITERALATGNESELSKLVVIAESYRKSVDKAVNTAVPESAIFIHLEMLNGMGEMEAVIRGLASVIRDPIVGIHGINQYAPAFDRWVNAWTGLRDYFVDESVAFEKGEAGYIWNYTE